ncbi:MAG: winged helix-turn-helix domain-containing protein [Thermoplasmata archaeon]|nr:winged helix-turn-helix domain-containing protein [Thermoplasmata archaeon]
MPTKRAEGSYRTRIEVLRDFLRAVGREPKKTRIIGVANLNPVSFRQYLDRSVALGLVRSVGTGYLLTPRADALLESIDRLLAKSSEVESALRDLHRVLGGPSPTLGTRPPTALRYVSRIAWGEVVRPGARPPGSAVSSAGPNRSSELSMDDLSLWWERDRGPASAEPRLAPPDRPEITLVPPPVALRRPSRGRPPK